VIRDTEVIMTISDVGSVQSPVLSQEIERLAEQDARGREDLIKYSLELAVRNIAPVTAYWQGPFSDRRSVYTINVTP
jgi:hypothetical protein